MQVIVEAWVVEGRLHWGNASLHDDDKLHVNVQQHREWSMQGRKRAR